MNEQGEPIPPVDLASIPTFAVVGRVNRGKSSIIATLAEEDSIAISPLPGTTRRTTAYDVSLHGRTLFRLVDTPGFEEASRALSWLQKTSPDASERRARVRAFHATFSGTDDFVEECELLGPILDGAAILYVVDGSTPFRENVMAEVEILRWTGQPRMALINRSVEGQHVATWQDALASAFSAVRNFDAHAAGFGERLRLLSLFRELVEAWREPLSTVISLLEREQERRLQESAREIANLVIDSVSHTLLVQGSDEGLTERQRAQAEQQFLDDLRELESKERKAVASLYRHEQLKAQHAEDLERPLFERDLFSERVWHSLGLSAGQLLATYSLAGASAGGTIDAMVGGASFLAGAVIGAAVGGATALWQLGDRALSITAVDGLRERLDVSAGNVVKYRVGPHQHPNFPFVVLDRALLHHQAVRRRSHALNTTSQLTVAGKENPSRHLTTAMSQRVTRALDKVRKNPEHEQSREIVLACVQTLLTNLDDAEGAKG